MSKYYDKTAASFKSVTIDTKVLDAQKILVKVPDNSSEERTDIIDYINESINNTNENIDTINTILGNKIFESSERSTATTVIDWDAIHYKDTTAVPHNTDIILITLIPQNTNTSVETYLAALYVNSSDEKTWLGMSDNSITWEEGKKATWTFLNNPLNVPDNCRLELFLTTSILNNPSGAPNHPGVYFASKASDNKQATHRYENYWDTYGGTPYTIFNSSSLISNVDALESNLDLLQEQVDTNTLSIDSISQDVETNSENIEALRQDVNSLFTYQDAVRDVNTMQGTLDNATVYGILYSKAHFGISGTLISKVTLPYNTIYSQSNTGYLVALVFGHNNQLIASYYSEGTHTFSNAGPAVFEFKDAYIAVNYKFIRFVLVANKTVALPTSYNSVNSNCLSFRSRPIKWQDSFVFDDDDCLAYSNQSTGTQNWLIGMTIDYKLRVENNDDNGEIRITSAHSLGDFYFSITSHMPDGVLPLNGSEVSHVTYSDLYNYVLNIHNELSTSGKKFIVSEEEWQNISIENNGYVPYYSYGITDGMFRLPRMSGYLKATGELDEAGNYVAEGLPNITGTLFTGGTDAATLSGAFTTPEEISFISYGTGGGYTDQDISTLFDASLSNPIYGNSEHVTPETNTLFVGVWALTAFTQVGTANLAEIKEILSQCETILGDSLPLLSSRYDNKGLETSAWKLSDGSWLDGRIYTDAYNKILQRITEGDTVCLEMKESELLSSNEFPENFLIDTENVKFRLPLFVVNERMIIKEWQEGTEWYTIYSDGWIEQGGEVYHNTKETHTVNLLVPFKNTDYNVTKSLGVDGIYTDSASVAYASISNYTTTSFDTRSSNNNGLNRFRWKACGHGEIPPREEWEIDFNYYFKVSHGVDLGRINIEEKLTEFEETAYTRLDEVVEEVSKDYVVHVDKQVGELYFSFDNYCPDGVIPLDGRLVSRTTYADLWEWVQEKGLVKDDTIITTNNENTVSIFNEDGSIRYCQWYGSGDGSLTFRVPKINGYSKLTGDNTVTGQYIQEGLPNLEGNINKAPTDYAVWNVDGVFSKTKDSAGATRGGGGGEPKMTNVNFNASRYNPIYGNSEHVTPETNTLFVGVWAITATKAAVFDMRDVEEALKSAESYLMNNVPLMSSRWDRDGLGNLGWVKADGSWVDGRHYTGAYNHCVEKLVKGHDDFIDGQVATISEENFDKFIVDRIGKRFRLPVSNGHRTWEEVQGLNNPDWTLYWKLAHEFYVPAQAEIQEKLNLIDNLVAKTDINLPTLSSRWDSDFAENIGWVKSEGHWLNGNVYRDAYNLMVSRIGINDKFVASTEGTELTEENADKFLVDTTAVKFRLPLVNGERVLVQSYYENSTYGHNSYEIYADGYCLQYYEYFPAATSGVMSLLKPFKNTNYNVTIGQSSKGTSTDTGGYGDITSIAGEPEKTTTSLRLSILANTGVTYMDMSGYVNILTPAEYNCGNYLYFKLADEVPSTVVDTEQVIADIRQECVAYKAGMDAILALGSDYICGCMIPDYTTGIDLTSNAETVMPYHALVYCLVTNSGGSGWAQSILTVNGVRVGIASVTTNSNDTCMIFVKKGDVVKVENQGEKGTREYINKYYRLSGASAE